MWNSTAQNNPMHTQFPPLSVCHLLQIYIRGTGLFLTAKQTPKNNPIAIKSYKFVLGDRALARAAFHWVAK